jgi:hypothetical protein
LTRLIKNPASTYSQKQYKAFSTDTKQFRLFQLFEVGLASFVAAQQPGAMDEVYLQLADKAKELHMFIPLAFILRDNEGGDGISGRTAVYNQTACHICCSCDATVAQYDTVVSDSLFASKYGNYQGSSHCQKLGGLICSSSMPSLESIF